MMERGLIGQNAMVNVSKQESGTVKRSNLARLIQAHTWQSETI